MNFSDKIRNDMNIMSVSKLNKTFVDVYFFSLESTIKQKIFPVYPTRKRTGNNPQ
jgi:hypothetical protein